jgi:hypothetical protein
MPPKERNLKRLVGLTSGRLAHELAKPTEPSAETLKLIHMPVAA